MGKPNGTPCRTLHCFEGTCGPMPGMSGPAMMQCNATGVSACPNQCDGNGNCKDCPDNYSEFPNACSLQHISGCSTNNLYGKCCCIAAWSQNAWCCTNQSNNACAPWQATMPSSDQYPQICENMASMMRQWSVSSTEYDTQAACTSACNGSSGNLGGAGGGSTSSSSSSAAASCGNGIVDSGEQCDHGPVCNSTSPAGTCNVPKSVADKAFGNVDHIDAALLSLSDCMDDCTVAQCSNTVDDDQLHGADTLDDACHFDGMFGGTGGIYMKGYNKEVCPFCGIGL